MREFLNIEIPVNIYAKNENEIKSIISNSIESNQSKFEPFFRREIDKGDARITILDGSLRVCEVVINGDDGYVEANFDSDYYAGCKDMNSTDEHFIILEFSIINEMIVFDIELPPAWVIEN